MSEVLEPAGVTARERSLARIIDGLTGELEHLRRGDMGEAELLAEFRALFNWNGTTRLTAKQWAKENGFSAAYISDVLNGKRGVADRLARALGYRRVVLFKRDAVPQGCAQTSAASQGDQ